MEKRICTERHPTGCQNDAGNRKWHQGSDLCSPRCLHQSVSKPLKHWEYEEC